MPSGHNEDLKRNDENHNTDEHKVGGHSFKEVNFIIDFSRAKHVEDLHPYKHVEND